jgi:hypothetical protein
MAGSASSKDRASGVAWHAWFVYGIASAVSEDVSEFFRSEEEARAVLECVWMDAPELKGLLWVEPIEFGEEAPN